MPRFYFDTHDGNTVDRDAKGHEFADMQAAPDMAMAVLPDMVRDIKTGDSERRVDVGDEDHRLIYTACMSLLELWML